MAAFGLHTLYTVQETKWLKIQVTRDLDRSPGCLFNDLLVPPLNGAFPLIEVDLPVEDNAWYM